MKQFIHRITDPNGMHARPAGMLATYAKRFDAQILVKANGKEADAKRLLSLMSLGATYRTELCFCISGENEDQVAAQLERFCREEWDRAEQK